MLCLKINKKGIPETGWAEATLKELQDHYEDPSNYIILPSFTGYADDLTKVTPFSCGYSNNGQTCYMLSILQCIFSLENGIKLIQRSLDRFNMLMKCPEYAFYGTLLDIVNKNLGRIDEYDKRTFAELFEKLTKSLDELSIQKNNSFRKNIQQDAHEFLVFIVFHIEHVFRECNAIISGNTDLRCFSLIERGVEFSMIFESTYLTQRQCSNNHISEVENSSLVWSLPIEGCTTVIASLVEFFACTQANKSQTNTFKCSRCQDDAVAFKEVSILHSYPNILCLHLLLFKHRVKKIFLYYLFILYSNSFICFVMLFNLCLRVILPKKFEDILECLSC